MKEVSLPQAERSYINVMESLVAEEVARQLQDVPARIRHYLRIEEVITYALNRLPALYASSERGWQYQRQVAKREMHRKIQDVVRRAIIAVQVDPIRIAEPLHFTSNKEAEAVLASLRTFFCIPDLSWSAALKQLNAFINSSNSLSCAAFPEEWRRPKRSWRPNSYAACAARAGSHVIGELIEEDYPTAVGWDNVLYRL